MTLWHRICAWFAKDEDDDWQDSFPDIPDGMECPDTQPTAPGALDSDLGRLE